MKKLFTLKSRLLFVLLLCCGSTATLLAQTQICTEATSSIGNSNEKGIYTVNIPSAGAYKIKVTYSSWENPDGATATIMFNGIAGANINLPTTGSPAVYREITFNKILIAGNNTITLSSAGGFYRVSKVCAETIGATAPIIDEHITNIGNRSEQGTYTLIIPKDGYYNITTKYTSWEYTQDLLLVVFFVNDLINISGGHIVKATPNKDTYNTHTITGFFKAGERIINVWAGSSNGIRPFIRVASIMATPVSSGGRIGSLSEPSQKDEVVVEAYPNPASDVLHLSYSLPYDSTVEIGIYDVLGQRHSNINQTGHTGNNQADIPVNKLSTGMYLLKLNYGQQSKTTKVLIKR